MKIYFISYSFVRGFGCLEVSMNRKIESIDDLNEIKDGIEKDNERLKDVIIINFIELKKLGRKTKQESKNG